MAQNAKIILQHNGNATFYAADNTQSALDAAVDGDTIYFNKGTFSGGFTITKKVALIGAGIDEEGYYQSIIDGNITVSIGSGEDILTARLLEGLYINGTVKVKKSIDNLVIRKCCFSTLDYERDSYKNDQGSTVYVYPYYSAIIDRCRLTYYLELYEYNKTLEVYNSYLYNVSKGYGTVISPEVIVFNNCGIERGGEVTATYRNCILGSTNSSSNNITAKYINCLCAGKFYTSAEYSNCWYNTNAWSLTNAELQEKGYIGDDGTIVGWFGGETPYTMVTDAPKITGYSSTVDPKARKVTVNLKVTQ